MPPSITRRRALGLLAGATTAGCVGLPEFSSVPTEYDHPEFADSATDTRAWSQFGYDAARTAASESPVPTGDVGGAWLRTPTDAGTTAPVVSGDVLYVGSGDSLVAYDSVGGTERWRVRLAGDDARDVALVDDAVVTATQTRDDGVTSALRGRARTDGAERWSVAFPGRLVGPLAVVDGVAYAAYALDDGGVAVAIDADGGERWRRELDFEPFTGFVGDAEGLFLTSVTDAVAAFDTDGAERWQRRVVPSFERGERPNLQGLPAADDALLYAPGVDGRLYAIERSDGSEAWTTTLLDDPKSNALPSPAVVDDTVYVSTHHAGLVAVGTDGTKRWSSDEPGGLNAPVAGPETVVAASHSAVRAYGHDGEERWTFELAVGDAPGGAGYAMAPTLASARGLVYAALVDGRVYAIGSSS